MIVGVWILTLALAAEFFMAPVNLWTGRTMDNFTRFTGLSPAVARTVFAPAKLVGAVLLVVGLAVPAVSIAGAALIALISVVYLVLLALPGRRSGMGFAAFGLTLLAAVGLIALQLGRV